MNDQTTKDPVVPALLQAEEKEVTVVQPQNESQDPRDNITPDHPRFKEVYEDLKSERETRKQLEQRLSELESRVSQSVKQDDGGYTQDEKEALQRILQGLKQEGGIVTKSDLEEVQRVQSRASTIKDLSDKYSGKNGYPKFDSVDVLEYAKKNGLGDNLEIAYRQLHWDAVVRAEASKIKNVDTVDSEETTTGQPTIAGLTPQDIGGMSLNEFAENEATIMDKFKKSIFKR